VRRRRWQESQHPRDGRGRFTDKWAGQVNDRLAGRGSRRDLVEDRNSWDWRRAMYEPDSDYSHSDQTLAAIYTAQGFHAKPQVVDQDEFDGMAQRGEIVPLYRGVQSLRSDPDEATADQIADDFRNGDIHYAGFGVYGNGTYASPSAHMAYDYGKTTSTRDGHLLRMALRPDARVVDFEQLRAEQQAATHSGRYQVMTQQVLDSSDELTPERLAAFREASERMRDSHDPDWEGLIGDMGRYAAMRGYDAIIASFDMLSERYREVVILNRGAVIVDREQTRPADVEEKVLGRGRRQGTKVDFGISD
jgi:hypothetical protein